MAKALLNEAERYLLQNWADAHLLEEAMEEVRTKYKALFERIVEAVTEAHPELDAHRWSLTQSWTDGNIGFGRTSWPADTYDNPAGLWINDLRLESVTAEDSEQPSASIWAPKKSPIDFDAARAMVKAEAKKLLTAEELKNTFWTESGEDTLLWLPTPSKRQLLDALLDGDGEAYVKQFVAQLDMMARFVPVLDKVFRECRTKE